MVAYNFQRQFVPAVEAGLKRQTIRAIGKRRHARPGDAIQLYTGMRTTACRKIVPDRVCTRVAPISLSNSYLDGPGTWIVDGVDLDTSGMHALAIADGFGDDDHPVFAMAAFFLEAHGARFDGVLIEWGEP